MMNQNVEKTKNTNDWIIAITNVCLCVLTILFFSGIIKVNVKTFEMFCDTDMYLDTLVAKLMWEQKTLFPENWIFGNQYYVVATPVLCAIIYGFIGDLNLAMGIASSLMAVFVIISYMWMIWPFITKKTNGLVGVVALFACLICAEPYKDYMSQLFFVMCSYYACYLTTAFLVWGQYIRINEKIAQRRIESIMIIGICLFLSFCTGMQSIRQTIVMVLPLCMLEGVQCICRIIRKQKVCTWPFGFVIAITVVNICGIIFIKKLNIPQHVIYGELKLVDTVADIKTNIHSIWLALRSLIGIGETTSRWILGIHGIVCVVILIAILLVLVSICKGKKHANGLSVLILLCACSFCVVIGGKLISSMALRTVYLFIWYPLASLCIIYLFECCNGKWYRYGIVAFALLSLKSYDVSYGYIDNAIVEQDAKFQESFHMVEWMEKNGYDVVYGGWDLASDIAAASNGAVIATCWPYESKENIFAIAPWIVNTDTLKGQSNENAVYIVRNENEEYLITKAKEMGVKIHREKICTAYTVYTADELLVYADEHILD